MNPEIMGGYCVVFNDFQNEERYSGNGAMPLLSDLRVSNPRCTGVRG